MPQEILNDAELIRLTLPTLRADVELVERYEYREEAPFACPITAFAGSRDFEEPVSVMGGWSKQTTGPFTLRVFEGDHFYLQSHEGELLEYLRSDLRRVLMFI
jgi:medium-chain acyl-[acyl-carrier-protein] hydrolase